MSEAKHERWWKFWHRRPRVPHHRFHWWAKYDSPLFAWIVFIGVPLMGWTIEDIWTQVVIAMIWMAVSSVTYFTIEGLEIKNHLDQEGLLSQHDADAQRNSLQWPYWGFVGALVVYALFFAIWAFTGIASYNGWYGVPGPLWYGPGFAGYGWVTVVLLIHAWVMGKTTIAVYFPILSNIQLLSSKVRRIEERGGITGGGH